MVDNPTPPRTNVNEILATLGRVQEVLHKRHGYAYEAEAFEVLVGELRDALSFSVPLQAVYDSLSHLAGTALMDDECKDVAWRLAGNVPRLRAGRIVPPWTVQAELEWAPMQILSVYPGKQSKKLPDNQLKVTAGAKLNIAVLGGTAAGKIVTRFYPYTYLLSSQLRSTFGFDKYDKAVFKRDAPLGKARPLRDVLEYTRCRFYGLLDPDLSRDGPMFDHIKVGPAFVKFNRELGYKRQRNGFECPMGYELASNPCYLCWKGYNGHKGCKAACHPIDYSPATCTKCQQGSQYFDLQRSAEVCVQCLNRSLF